MPPGEGIRVRPAAPGDAAAMGRVHVASWRAAYRGIVPDEVLAALSEEERAEAWRGRLEGAPRPVRVLVAVEGEEVVGFASVGRGRDADAAPQRTGELYALYLHPEQWGRGVGRRLWSAARQWLVVEEYSEATCWVLEENRRARAFYERMGFVLDPGARKEFRVGEAVLPEVRYRLPLS